MPTRLVSLGNPARAAVAQKLAEVLRRQDPPIVGRISENILLLDPRSVDPRDDAAVIAGLGQLEQQFGQA